MMSPVAHPVPPRTATPDRARPGWTAWPHTALLVASFLAGMASPGPAQAQAVGGVDVVSLRDAGRVVGGDAAISTHWKGHEWRFANEVNRATFEANPRVYAPAFGGNCPVALAEGERRPGLPELFVLVGKSLYLTSSPRARQRLTENPQAVLGRAAIQWKRLQR